MHKTQKQVKNFKKKLTKKDIEELALKDQVTDYIAEAQSEPIASNVDSLLHFADATMGSGAVVPLTASSGTVAGVTTGIAGLSATTIAGVGILTIGGIATIASNGGSSVVAPVDTSLQKVYLVDSAVEGVDYYLNGVLAGQTGVDGSFFYSDGDYILFKIAGITMGEITVIPNDNRILLQDLVGVDRSDISNPIVVKLAQILQTLDSDNNPANGITIDASRLKDNLNLIVNESTIVEDLFDSGTNIVTPEDAIAHIEEMIGHIVQENGNATPILNLGEAGRITTDFEGYNDFVRSVVVDSQGDIIVAGYAYSGGNYDFAVAKYNSNGSLDTSFSGDGKVMASFEGYNNDYGRSIIIDNFGHIVIAGYASNGSDYDFSLARYNGDGSLDTSLGGTGKVMTNFEGYNDDYGRSVVVDSQDHIIVAGYSYNGVNYDFSLARYNGDGSLDTSLGGTGKVMINFEGYNDYGQSIIIDNLGHIVIAGYTYNGSNYDFAIARHNNDGGLDTSFGNNGKVITDFSTGSDSGQSVLIDGNGDIVVAGYAYNGVNNDFAIARYNSDGSLDTSFGNNGKVTTDFSAGSDSGQSVLIDGNGDIVVAGYVLNGSYYDFAIARYNSDGSLDTSFGNNGKVTTDFVQNHDYGSSITMDSSGNILVAGYVSNGSDYDFAVAKYNSNGTLNEDFGMVFAVASNTNPVILSPNAMLYDLESVTNGNYSGGVLTISRDGGANTDDNFGGSNLLVFDGANVLYGGVDVGNFSEVGGTLSIAFDNDATQAVVDGILSSITYSNNNFTNPIVLNWGYNDGINSIVTQQSII